MLVLINKLTGNFKCDSLLTNLHGGTHVKHHVGNDCYRKLRITRVILHRNLVMAIVIRNIFSILVKTTITLDALADSADSVRKYTSFFFIFYFIYIYIYIYICLWFRASCFNSLIIQQDATIYSPLRYTLHVSGDNHTHHQEY